MNNRTIWTERQNKPSYIVRDLSEYAPEDVVYETLLRRGVFKWLSARRKIVKVKNEWKARITASIYEQQQTGDFRRRHWLRGYRAGLEECRRELRAICHGPRWEAPDFDRPAAAWLSARGAVEFEAQMLLDKRLEEAE